MSAASPTRLVRASAAPAGHARTIALHTTADHSHADIGEMNGVAGFVRWFDGAVLP